MELYSWCVQVPVEEKTRSVTGNEVSGLESTVNYTAHKTLVYSL